MMARKWTRNGIVWTCYGVFTACVVAIGIGAAATSTRAAHPNTTAPTPAQSEEPATATTVPLLIDQPTLSDDQIEGYYYCWDTGSPGPHRIGHWVAHDHLCTWGELRYSGVVWMG